MKKNYVRPTMVGERFVADEFVAACGDTAYGMYKFKCTAGGGLKGDLTSADGEINYTDGKQHSELGGKTYTSYHACDATHEASTQDVFIKGRFYKNGGNDQLRGAYDDVYIWFEPLGRNSYDIHATTNLNRDSWETTKS